MTTSSFLSCLLLLSKVKRMSLHNEILFSSYKQDTGLFIPLVELELVPHLLSLIPLPATQPSLPFPHYSVCYILIPHLSLSICTSTTPSLLFLPLVAASSTIKKSLTFPAPHYISLSISHLSIPHLRISHLFISYLPVSCCQCDQEVSQRHSIHIRAIRIHGYVTQHYTSS